MRILTAEQMREADRQTIEEIGIPSLVLMENAGRQVVAAMEAEFDDLADRRVVVLSGRGNNGGDGFVIARVLEQRGIQVSVFVIGPLSEVRGDALVNLEILGRLGFDVVEVAGEEQWELHSSEVRQADIIVDAIFGTGLSQPLRGFHETIVADVNSMDVPVVSVDLPSGMDSNSAHLLGPCIVAHLTVTLAAPKLPLVLSPACGHAGRLVVADIGIPADVIEALEGARVEWLTSTRLQALLPERAVDAHKGSFGHVLVVAGSRGKTGAAALAALGALRSGAGLVTVATPDSCQAVVASLGAEFMTVPLPEAGGGLAPEAADLILALPCDVIALGPGLGMAPGTRSVVQAILERASVPLLLDADALNAFGDDPGRLTARDGQQVVVTPHPGEMARLMSSSATEVQANRLESARNLATARNLTVVLKGHQTVIATPDGGLLINPTGNPGMATGGTGDVLTGAIAAWLAQVRDAETASVLGVYLHGAAGDLAAADTGQVAMTAGDLADYLGEAVLALAGATPSTGGLQ